MVVAGVIGVFLAGLTYFEALRVVSVPVFTTFRIPRSPAQVVIEFLAVPVRGHVVEVLQVGLSGWLCRVALSENSG